MPRERNESAGLDPFRALLTMAHRYQKHYTRQEARALLPQIRSWLAAIIRLRDEVQKQEKRLQQLLQPGRDLGGDLVNEWVRTMARIKDVLLEFEHREIEIKDVDRGLIDFPALRGDKEVFLCWEMGEEDIEFWHDLDAGYRGRERLGDLE
jgi:hypothetical protein